MAFGYVVQDDDLFIKVSEEAAKITNSATTPGRWLIDYLPICTLSHLPVAEATH